MPIIKIEDGDGTRHIDVNNETAELINLVRGGVEKMANVQTKLCNAMKDMDPDDRDAILDRYYQQ